MEPQDAPDARETMQFGDPIPTSYAETMTLAMSWATGKRSHSEHLRLKSRDGDSHAQVYGLTVTADAAEAQKWAAIAVAMAAEEKTEVQAAPAVDVDRLRSKVADLIDDLERLPDSLLRPGGYR